MSSAVILTTCFLSVMVAPITLAFHYDYELNRDCKSTEFSCANQRKCLRLSVVCDGYPDCVNGDDETNCTECKGNAFHCSNNVCVAGYKRCNGKNDCRSNDEKNSDDELNCESFTCPEDLLKCGNHKCVAAWTFCNGMPECADGSDESNCTQCPSYRPFHCKTGSKCLHSVQRCDGTKDCSDNSDEVDCRLLLTTTVDYNNHDTTATDDDYDETTNSYDTTATDDDKDETTNSYDTTATDDDDD